MKKRVFLFGASGSIGKNAIAVLEQFPEVFSLIGISAKTSSRALLEVASRHPVEVVYIDELEAKKELEQEFRGRIYCGKETLSTCIQETSVDIVVNALPGSAGLLVSEEGIEKGIPLALANKESLVMAGIRLMKRSKETGSSIIPIDSEHSALAELLSKTPRKMVKKLWLTGSGGPFRSAQVFPKSSFPTITKEQALNHPTWKMGAKISIDSATLMNKAFEMIEAVRLFDFAVEDIRVVIHPESIVHGAIELHDGSVLMECSSPDMKLPIARALFRAAHQPFPESFSLESESYFGKSFHFEAVDEERFPSLQFARNALKKGEKSCADLVRINDEAVELFLNEKIRFDEIFERLGRIFG
jgi:1-deoxy-D-xylulose-5-phosphate reductoisomerase